MKKLLSIIIPSFNMEAFLGRCLDSLGLENSAIQESLDVVVVNDGSKDGTSGIAHEYEKRYANVVRVIDKQNGHYGSCINAALKVVAGEFVKILEPDDVYNTKDFRAFVTELKQLSADERFKEVDLFVTDYASINAAGEISRSVHYEYPPHEVIAFDAFQKPLKYHILLPAVTYRMLVFRSGEYRQTEGCPYTDLEWLTYPMSRVRNVCYLPYSIYRYFIGREGQTVDPASFSKNIGVIAKLMCRMLCDYETLVGNGRAGVKEYVDKVIATQVGLVYRSFLLEKNPYLKLSDVLTLSDAVSKTSTSLVELTDKALHSHIFDFRYVREFRRARTRKTLKFALLDAYSWLRKTVG